MAGRKPFTTEQEKRDQSSEIIKNAQRLVYLSPAVLAEIARRQGWDIERQYFNRRYEELGIIYDGDINQWIKA